MRVRLVRMRLVRVRLVTARLGAVGMVGTRCT